MRHSVIASVICSPAGEAHHGTIVCVISMEQKKGRKVQSLLERSRSLRGERRLYRWEEETREEGTCHVDARISESERGIGRERMYVKSNTLIYITCRRARPTNMAGCAGHSGTKFSKDPAVLILAEHC